MTIPQLFLTIDSLTQETQSVGWNNRAKYQISTSNFSRYGRFYNFFISSLIMIWCKFIAKITIWNSSKMPSLFDKNKFLIIFASCKLMALSSVFVFKRQNIIFCTWFNNNKWNFGIFCKHSEFNYFKITALRKLRAPSK